MLTVACKTSSMSLGDAFTAPFSPLARHHAITYPSWRKGSKTGAPARRPAGTPVNPLTAGAGPSTRSHARRPGAGVRPVGVSGSFPRACGPRAAGTGFWRRNCSLALWEEDGHEATGIRHAARVVVPRVPRDASALGVLFRPAARGQGVGRGRPHVGGVLSRARAVLENGGRSLRVGLPGLSGRRVLGHGGRRGVAVLLREPVRELRASRAVGALGACGLE